jgi:hypothetical protein
MSIQISFHTNFSKFFHEIFLVENNNIDYYDNSHMNYIYTYKIDNIEYTFNGFFKDDYFVITLDSYDIELLVNIEIKYVLLLKLDWKKIYFNDKNIYILDIKDNKNLDTYILNIRKKLNTLTNISIDDYLRFNNYEIISSTIKDISNLDELPENINNEENNNNKSNILSKIKNFIFK